MGTEPVMALRMRYSSATERSVLQAAICRSGAFSKHSRRARLRRRRGRERWLDLRVSRPFRFARGAEEPWRASE